jgi:ferredoxin, 2Fe-2S
VAKITYVGATGIEHVVEVKPGLSVMEGAVKLGVPGILGECGGNCQCGTCRVYVDQLVWREKTGERSELEQAMIEYQQDRDPNVRCSCQIKVSESLDGLVVRLPKSQHST